MRAWLPGIAILAALVASSAAAQAPLSAAQERALKAKDRFQECAGCPELVVVPGRLEVTVDQFAAFVDATGHDLGTACDV